MIIRSTGRERRSRGRNGCAVNRRRTSPGRLPCAQTCTVSCFYFLFACGRRRPTPRLRSHSPILTATPIWAGTLRTGAPRCNEIEAHLKQLGQRYLPSNQSLKIRRARCRPRRPSAYVEPPRPRSAHPARQCGLAQHQAELRARGRRPRLAGAPGRILPTWAICSTPPNDTPTSPCPTRSRCSTTGSGNASRRTSRKTERAAGGIAKSSFYRMSNSPFSERLRCDEAIHGVAAPSNH